VLRLSEGGTKALKTEGFPTVENGEFTTQTVIIAQKLKKWLGIFKRFWISSSVI